MQVSEIVIGKVNVIREYDWLNRHFEVQFLPTSLVPLSGVFSLMEIIALHKVAKEIASVNMDETAKAVYANADDYVSAVDAELTKALIVYVGFTPEVPPVPRIPTWGEVLLTGIVETVFVPQIDGSVTIQKMVINIEQPDTV
jgi:hypothetical protein